jgi:TetR/AcrR family transcriptional regulator
LHGQALIAYNTSNSSITLIFVTVIDKPSKQRTEVRQASLVEAALRLAAQRSPADITTGDLAQAVGITQGAVFRHFASKEAIWLAVLDWVTQTLMSRLQAAAPGTQASESAAIKISPSEPELAKRTLVSPSSGSNRSALTALQAVFMTHVDFVVAHPGVPRVIFLELQQPHETAPKARVRDLLLQYRQLLMQLLQQAKTQQAIAPDIDLRAAAVLFIGSVQGLVMQALISGDVPAMAVQAPGVFAIFQRGLLVQAPL